MKRFLLAWVAMACLCAGPRAAHARPDQLNSPELWHYAASDKVESTASVNGNFRLHFTQTGVNSVPAGDADKNGVPDHVESLALLYEQVLAFYQKLGFLQPRSDKDASNNGGDGKFDVYLLDFAGKADGSFVKEQCKDAVCYGFMVQENDFKGYNYPSLDYANRVLSSHEFFHAVQASYNADQGSLIAEGTAVWATEKFDQSLKDFEDFLPGYLNHPDRPIDKPMLGPVDQFSYGAAIFFEFLDEQLGNDVILHLWQDCKVGAQGVANPQWLPALVALLAREFKTTFADEFATFATWNMFTGKYADAKRSYLHGDGYAKVARTVGQLPYRDDDFRLYYASAQYVAAPPDGRGQLTAAVVSKQDLTNLRLKMILRTGLTLSDPLPVALDAKGQPTVIDGKNADEVIVYAVNVASSGDSLKGSLCVGAPEEVAACLPHTDAPDATSTAADSANPPDAGSLAADGSDQDAQAVAVPSAAPTGCQANTRACGDWRAMLLICFGLLAVAARRAVKDRRVVFAGKNKVHQ